MRVTKLSVENFRNLYAAEIQFPDAGVVLIKGNNGQGKSNLLEAIGLLGASRSFRRAQVDALVRNGEQSAFLRGEAFNDERELLVEMELSPGRSRTFVNKQRQMRSRRLDEMVPVTSFSPTDLEFVKGSPQIRRELVDELLASVSERFRVVEGDFNRALKQRNSLLKQCRGRLSSDAEVTLEVWDERISSAGDAIAEERSRLVDELNPLIESTYRRISGSEAVLRMTMTSTWALGSGGRGLADALRSSRADDLRREVTTVGPHRDDIDIRLQQMAARTHASQGEQRSIAVATKLASHNYCAKRWNRSPILLLDDVFSELDDQRVERFLGELPPGQVFIASAAGHAMVDPVTEICVEQGKLLS